MSSLRLFRGIRRIPSLVLACALLAIMYGAITAYADEDLSATDGALSPRAETSVAVSYMAYDDVRYPDQGDHYPLPAPHEPLRFDAVMEVPPSDADIDAHREDFEGYVFMSSDYYDGALTYYYYWHEMDEAKAKQMFQDYVDGRPSEQELEEQRRLFEADEWDKLIVSDDGAAEYDGPVRSQEEMLADAKRDYQNQMDQAMAEGNLDEVERLKLSIEEVERDEAEYAERISDDGAPVANSESDPLALGAIAVTIAVIVVTALTITLIVRHRRNGGNDA